MKSDTLAGEVSFIPALDRQKTVCPHIPAKSKYRLGIFQEALSKRTDMFHEQTVVQYGPAP